MRLQRTGSSPGLTLARLGVGLVAVALVAGGCASGSASSSKPATTGAGAGSSPTSGASGSTGATTLSQRDVRTAAERLLGKALVPAGAHRVTRAPSAQLRHSLAWPGAVGHVVKLSRYWVVDEPESQLRRWLAQHEPGGTSGDSTGSSSSRGQATVSTTDFEPRQRPAGLALDSMTIATVALSPTRTAVGAFVEALAQPARPAWSVVPTSGASVTISWRIASGGTPALKVLTGAAATPFVRGFDALTVSTSGVHRCPMMVAGAQVGLSFKAAGRTWTTTLTNCPPLQVRQGSSTVQLNSGTDLYGLVAKVIGREPGVLPIKKRGTLTPLARTPRTPGTAKK